MINDSKKLPPDLVDVNVANFANWASKFIGDVGNRDELVNKVSQKIEAFTSSFSKGEFQEEEYLNKTDKLRLAKSWVKDKTAAVNTWFKDLGNSISIGFKDLLIDPIKNNFTGIVNSIRDSLTDAINFLKQKLEDLKDWFRNQVDVFKDTGKNIKEKATKGVKAVGNLLGIGKARGGEVIGQKQGEDQNLIPISSGEYVLKRSAVEGIKSKLGSGFLDRLNSFSKESKLSTLFGNTKEKLDYFQENINKNSKNSEISNFIQKDTAKNTLFGKFGKAGFKPTNPLLSKETSETSNKLKTAIANTNYNSPKLKNNLIPNMNAEVLNSMLEILRKIEENTNIAAKTSYLAAVNPKDASTNKILAESITTLANQVDEKIKKAFSGGSFFTGGTKNNTFDRIDQFIGTKFATIFKNS